MNSRAVPLALRLAIVLVAIVAGGIGAVILFPTRRPADDGDEPEDTRPRRLAGERGTAATAQLQAALNACSSLPARLTHIADAADAKAAALRDAHDAGLVPAPHSVNPDWRPPWELHRDSPRLPVIAWQQLDRAFDELAATLDDPDADLRAHAHGYEQLATAARHVAGELAGDETDRQFSSELARCAFCGKAARDVKRIITGRTTAICDECVDLCAWTLDDELGDSWRGPRPD